MSEDKRFTLLGDNHNLDTVWGTMVKYNGNLLTPKEVADLLNELYEEVERKRDNEKLLIKTANDLNDKIDNLHEENGYLKKKNSHLHELLEIKRIIMKDCDVGEIELGVQVLLDSYYEVKRENEELIDLLNNFNEAEKRVYNYFSEWFSDIDGLGYPTDFNTLWENIKNGKEE